MLHYKCPNAIKFESFTMLYVVFNFYMFCPSYIHHFYLLLNEGVEKALSVKGMNGKPNTYFGIALWKGSLALIYRKMTLTPWDTNSQLFAPH